MEQPLTRFSVTDMVPFAVDILQVGQDHPVTQQAEGAVHNFILPGHLVTDPIAGVEHDAYGAGRHLIQ
ncbi:hypothetical protein D3C75_1348160 [compost metagenome]